MKKLLQIIIFSALFIADAIGQSYPTELLKYSVNNIGGTARSIGAGGAFSSVGADMGAAMSNPAGLGLYRSSEVSGSLGLLFNKDNTTYAGNTISSNTTAFNLPHLGAVFAIPLRRAGKSTDFLQFGLVYQRTADFNRNQSFNGQNNFNSKMDVYFNELSATNDPITYDYYTPGAVQAWNTYLIDTFNGQLFKRVFAPINQSGYYKEKGGANEFNLTMSGNIQDKVYIGGAIGIPWLNYSREKVYSESINYTDSVYGFRSFDQFEYYRAKGVGVNFKLGVIVRPVDFWRIGASISTPTLAFNLTENSTMSTSSKLSGLTQNFTFDSDTFASAPFTFAYNRPLKATFGTSFIISKYGFLSLDYELADYKSISLGFDASSKAIQESYNKEIRALYGIGHTVRVGGEFAWNVLRIRGGYNWQSSPFRNGVSVKGNDMQTHTVTAGLGYRGKRFFADVAYARSMMNDYLSLYKATSNEPGLKSNLVVNRILVTVGFRFGKTVN